MATFNVDGFAKGMDTRRPPWAANASTLNLAEDVVLNEGGDAEARKAFVPKFTGIGNTFGLHAIGDAPTVFGVAAVTPPAGLEYIRAQPIDGSYITRVLSVDLFDGKPYIAALMSDASTRHFYDADNDDVAEEVTDWFDGRARGFFDITAGSAGSVSAVQVNGVDVLGVAVVWASSHVATAAAVAAQINSYASTPNYSATSVGTTVVVIALDGTGETPNGYDVTVIVTGDVLVATPTDMANGVTGTSTPGSFVKTIDSKLYAPSDSLLNFSGIDGPTQWNTDADGAGFVDMSRAQAGAEVLKSLEEFLSEVAVFAQKAIQIWHLEADDINNRRLQTFKDIGTDAQAAVAQFRYTDVFFLERFRGICAIVPSTTNDQFARIEDVGLPIKKYLNAYKATLTADVIEQALMFVEPGSARLWAVLGERVFVMSWHPADGIEGWTVFKPGFQITGYAVANGRLYLRSDATIYLYGGDDDDEYPEADVGVITFSAFRASAPEAVKRFTGIDIGVEGAWQAWLYASARDTVGRQIAVAVRETFEDADVPVVEMGANPILKLTRKSAGYARVSQLVVNYTPRHSG